jgi:hypothetical protein
MAGNIVDIIKYTSGIVNSISGTGTTNELAYFTASTTISSLTTATYPSLTELSYVKGVTSSIQTQLNGKQAAGTYVTAVTASSPLASGGGTTPNITIQQASGSQNGFLSSTDWSTFNSKQNTLTNPVTGTGTTNTLPKFTGSTTIGNSLFTDDGTNGAFGGANYYSGTSVRTFNISAPLYPGLGFFANNVTTGNIFSYAVTGNLILNADPSNLFGDTRLILATDNVERLTVFSDGNVSIDNSPTNQSYKLYVNGIVRFTSSVTSLVNNISADGAGVVLQGYVDNILRIAVRGSGYNDGARGGLLASTADFSSSVIAASLSLSGTIASGGDAATLTIKQAGTTFTNGIYLERAGERNGYYMYIGGALDALTFRRNYFGTQSDVLSLNRDGTATFSSSVKLEANGVPAFLYFNNIASPASNYIALGSGANELYIHVNGADRIVVKNTGSVGIGTPNPASKLAVTGGIAFSNNTDGTANLSYGGRASAKSTSVTGGAGATLIHRGLGSVGYFILVSGLHSGNRFMDLIYGTGSNTPIVLASNTENTAPTRTYSISGENIFVSLSGGAVWTVVTTGLGAMES